MTENIYFEQLVLTFEQKLNRALYIEEIQLLKKVLSDQNNGGEE
ncbi:hypothetical protein [Halalkalibacter krulwichiae]|uniref:Uncharacterized protein n=1 Tax=Halalkalibacter krulwichiae TaxID=199441 RepID=A0A1X9MFN7_9BACI|nr:hypothetical protein [Halalkalibacter krulwichiae]ARK32259.1 hypothetical protein BkAM31D_21710 [Halalkalibacter krulwichiae]